MFICSECGTKYEIMPKFCDCGNDIFIEEEAPKPEPQIEEIPQEQPTRKRGRGKVESFSPAAIGAFALCLISALVILLFIGNPKKEELAQEIIKEEQIEQPVNIPAIDTFWDNTTPKAIQQEEKKEEPQEKPAINIVPKFVQNILPPETKKAQVPKTNKTAVSKPASTPKTQTVQKTSAQKPQTQTNSQTNQQAQAITNKIKNNIQYNNQSKQNTPVPVQTSTQQQTQTQTQTKTPPATQITQPQTTAVNKNPAPVTTTVSTPAPVIKTKTQAELTKELNTYKASLRNTIGRKIDFTKVIGDGDCALTFKINSSGRLISKAFSKQSSNITLNDAVFTAMNSTTSFNPPPEGYKGETLTLKIKFYNGNFEITLN